MRITNQIIADHFLSDLNTHLSQLDVLNSQASTGKRILKPSDDPVGTAADLAFQTSLNQLAQYKKNADGASAALHVTLSTLSQVQDVITKARTLALTAANDVNTPTTHQAVAAEVAGLQQQLLALSNTQYDGNYIFGGFQTSASPFNGAGIYRGDTGQTQSTIAPGLQVTVNIDGQKAFKSGVDLFQFLSTLQSDLLAGNTTGIQSAITTADSALDHNLQVQGAVGSSLQMIQAHQTANTDVTLKITDLRSKNSDADFTRVIADLQAQQNAYQASLAAGAQLLKLSLLNYWNR